VKKAERSRQLRISPAFLPHFSLAIEIGFASHARELPKDAAVSFYIC